MSVTNIDWESIRWEFENIECTLGDLVNKYGSYRMQISRKSKEEEWVKFDPVKRALAEHSVTTAPNPQGILDTVAVRKIEEIIKELGSHYSPVDEPLIVMYGKTYQVYLELTAKVDAEGDVIYSSKTGSAYTNPRFNNLQAIQNNLTKLGDRLGLSIAARKRLGLKLGAEDSTGSLFSAVENMSKSNKVEKIVFT